MCKLVVVHPSEFSQHINIRRIDPKKHKTLKEAVYPHRFRNNSKWLDTIDRYIVEVHTFLNNKLPSGKRLLGKNGICQLELLKSKVQKHEIGVNLSSWSLPGIKPGIAHC